MRIDIITIFPEYFAPLGVSLIGKAAERGDIQFGVHDLRTWTHDAHHSVDDAPFGGGPGMVATEYARESHLVFGCGRYEGIDARVAAEARARMPVDEVTIGDYVLAGGEPAVLVMIEAVCRLLPGVMGNADSASDDSFGGGAGPMAGLVEGPAYTRPRVWRGREVPPVLLSGDHAAIARWRRDAALRRTAANRPDLAARLASGPGETATARPGPAAAERMRLAAQLDARDRQVLSDAGFPLSGQGMAH